MGGGPQRDPRSAASGQEQPCLLIPNAIHMFLPPACGPARRSQDAWPRAPLQGPAVFLSIEHGRFRPGNSVINMFAGMLVSRAFLSCLSWKFKKSQHQFSVSAWRERASTRLFPSEGTPPSSAGCSTRKMGFSRFWLKTEAVDGASPHIIAAHGQGSPDSQARGGEHCAPKATQQARGALPGPPSGNAALIPTGRRCGR